MTIRCARTVALIKRTLLGLTSVEGGLVHLEHVYDNENASHDTGSRAYSYTRDHGVRQSVRYNAPLPLHTGVACNWCDTMTDDIADPFVVRWLTWCSQALQSHKYPIRSLVDVSSPLSPDTETREDVIARGRCEQWKEDLLRTSPMVRFMVKHLTLIQCNPLSPREDSASEGTPPKLLIASCPPDIAGGFSPSPPERPTSESGILLCANRIFSKAHLEDTISHEMIHWWDHCRFKVDWGNLRHHACSEVRVNESEVEKLLTVLDSCCVLVRRL